MRLFAAFVVITFAIAADCGRAADATRSTVLVELFTSEGCSTCPPADDLLQRIDATQPVPGAQVIVLSEHVDYWNHDGWRDPYSSSFWSDRQSGYVHALGLNTPYTPQIIVDGAAELRANSAEQIVEILEKAAAAIKVPVKITSLRVDPKMPGLIHAHIEADGTLEKHNADIFLVAALDHAESQVLSGENSGHHLAHVAVVQQIVKVGKLEKQKTFAQDVEIKLKSGTDPASVRIVCFVQESAFGKVHGAALERIVN
jgi:hypothetical protein